MRPRREIDLRVGRRAQDGTVSLSTIIPDLLTLRVTHGAERSSAVQLTLEQVGELRRTLAEMERSMTREEKVAGAWDGKERRKPAA